MATIEVRDQETVKVEVTSDYCFEQAARILMGTSMGLGNVEYAREWRQLGEAIWNAEP